MSEGGGAVKKSGSARESSAVGPAGLFRQLCLASGRQVPEVDVLDGARDPRREGGGEGHEGGAAAVLGEGERLRDGPSVFFFQAEDGIRAGRVTGVQTCALPI